MSGHFDSNRILPAVTGCVKSAIDDLERAEDGAVSFAGAG
jgi:hypothetical protein